MQIIVNDCDNERPLIDVPPDTCVEAGTLLKSYAVGTDPDITDEVKIEAFSEVFNLAVPKFGFRATLNPATPAFKAQPDTLFFEWQTSCPNVKSQPYQVVFKISDKPAGLGTRLASFATWNITVIGPKPVWQNIALNGQVAELEWEPYACSAEAESIQIWRRVDSLMYEPDDCELGISDNLGYELIATVPASEVSFDDNNNGLGLAPGAIYCYRLVATFPSPRG
jgi:hypothetical protein